LPWRSTTGNMIATRTTGTDNDGYLDAISLVAVP
jgi:hypothetical protein